MRANALGRLHPREIPARLRQLQDTFTRTEFSELLDQVRPFTMLSHARLRALHAATQRIVTERIPGSVVECGTARGGSAALLACSLSRLHDGRSVWVFDSFEGMPPPSLNDPDYGEAVKFIGACRGELEEVLALFDRLDVLGSVRIVPGLFKDTVHTAPVGQISLLHLDGDWYESTRVCLEAFYDKVSEGGIIQLDDYGYWEGCRAAVHDFFDQRHEHVQLRYVDRHGRQIIKGPSKRT